jgi:hypothetical protein
MSGDFKQLLAMPLKDIQKATGALSKLWRKMLFDLNITPQQSERLIHRYLRDDRHKIASGSDRSSARNNLSNELAKPDMTWKNFMRGNKLLAPKESKLVMIHTWPNGEKTQHEVDIEYYYDAEENEGAEDVSD